MKKLLLLALFAALSGMAAEKSNELKIFTLIFDEDCGMDWKAVRADIEKKNGELAMWVLFEDLEYDEKNEFPSEFILASYTDFNSVYKAYGNEPYCSSVGSQEKSFYNNSNGRIRYDHCSKDE